ncbi:MAG: type II secretion system GspH family protein [Candidatus Omnitrophica bacterium]|nr:type II secretion system GspH family protein [Candidatus Omnitrophota bacterium]
MKRGFTLLELLVVIIIIGVLATLGIQQYGRMIERARGAEARMILGQIRSTAAAYRLERGSCTGFDNTAAGIGTGADQIPSACRATHYFSYTVSSTANGFTATATRCTTGGKTPNGSSPLTLTLTTDFNAGTDTWGGTGGY